MIEISSPERTRARAQRRGVCSVVAGALVLLSTSAGCAESHGLASRDPDVDRADSGVPITRDPAVGGMTECGPSNRAPLCASPWDASSLFCCEVTGPAACVDGAWSCASAPALRPGSSVFARECDRSTWACEGAPPPPGEPRGIRALFFLDGRADLGQVHIFASDWRGGSRLECGGIGPGMGAHLAIALESRPVPGRETTYAWGEGRTRTVTVQRCADLGVGCVVPSEGQLTLTWLEGPSRLAAIFTASYPDGTTEERFELVAEMCPGDAPARPFE